MSIQLLIIDDHGVIRDGLNALLTTENDLVVIGEAADGQTALHLAEQLQPDIILMDISLPDTSGIEVMQQLKARLPKLHVIMLTVHEDEELLREAIQAGASGYIVKRAIGSELIDAIRTVWAGNLYVHPTMTRALLKDLSTDSAAEKPTNEPTIESLTPREIEVLCLIAQGYTNRLIAETLGISVRTVEGHRANLVDKIGSQSRVDLMRFAKEYGLVE